MAGIEDFKGLGIWHPLFDNVSEKPSDLRLLIVGNTEVSRRETCNFFKKLLEEKFEEEKKLGNLEQYDVQVIDASKIDKNYLDSEAWERAGLHDRKIYVPIHHNSDNLPELPQIAFDSLKPGIFSYTQEGWMNIFNRSKRDCYRRISV
ncbi:hypothetical protein HN747_01655 [archaeon]|jgi:hypothetical protein|nr:hypothetical protein [archaeon]